MTRRTTGRLAEHHRQVPCRDEALTVPPLQFTMDLNNGTSYKAWLIDAGWALPFRSTR